VSLALCSASAVTEANLTRARAVPSYLGKATKTGKICCEHSSDLGQLLSYDTANSCGKVHAPILCKLLVAGA
jgi:hypothetical protein